MMLVRHMLVLCDMHCKLHVIARCVTVIFLCLHTRTLRWTLPKQTQLLLCNRHTCFVIYNGGACGNVKFTCNNHSWKMLLMDSILYGSCCLILWKAITASQFTQRSINQAATPACDDWNIQSILVCMMFTFYTLIEKGFHVVVMWLSYIGICIHWEWKYGTKSLWFSPFIANVL